MNKFKFNGKMREKKMNKFDGAVELIPPLVHRFTMDEWFLNNNARDREYQTHCQLVESAIDESKRICDATLEITKSNKFSTDKKLEEKIENIEFCKNELLRVRKEMVLEIDALITYKCRLSDAFSSITRNAAIICEKCLVAREHRIGIDLTIDNVEKELRKEYKVIKSTEKTVIRTLEQVSEQIRALKSTLYDVDRDLTDKDKNFQIDRHNLNLKETSLNLSVYHGTAPLDGSNITLEEWEISTNDMIIEGKKQLNTSKVLRNYVDVILREVVDDLNNQVNDTNNAFKMRISETKEAKTKLELQHSEIIRKSNDMISNIANLEKMIAEKEGFIALAHTRLGNRCQRPSLEMTSDLVEKQLISEVADLRDSVRHLQQTLFEAQAILRYVLKTQIQIEEDINVKTQTLKIDEVECMTMRQGLEFHAY